MQQILEFIPLVLFFFAYFSDSTLSFGDWSLVLGNIYAATTVLMAAMLVQVILSKLLFKQVEKRTWITFAIVMIFGTLTIVLKNNLFIQWKPTITNWLFAIAFIVGPRFTQGEPLIKKALGAKLTLPDHIWARLTSFLIFYSVFIGALNLLVVYNFSEAFWVEFKLWSALASSIIMTAIIIYIVAPYLNENNLTNNNPDNQEKKF